MRAVIVDDEQLMLRSFCRYTANIPDFEIVGQFDDSIDAYEFIRGNAPDAVFLDIEMPEFNGVDMARRLKKHFPDMLIVFVTAYDNYIKQANEIGADYYLVKPYTEEIMAQTIGRLKKLLPEKKEKPVFIRTFGRFGVFVNGKPVALVGKTKEILALVVSRRGREISNEELYSTIWEGREYDNIHMKVYYNALKRLRTTLTGEGIADLLISTTRGQMLNTELCDCDYFAWLDGDRSNKNAFEGEFMSEYSWGEPILALLDTE